MSGITTQTCPRSAFIGGCVGGKIIMLPPAQPINCSVCKGKGFIETKELRK